MASIQRLRKDAIEKRRQDCQNIVKERKRRLSELFCVSRSPLIPISNDKVVQIEPNLNNFLAKNDLEQGHEFSVSALQDKKRHNDAVAAATTISNGEPPRKMARSMEDSMSPVDEASLEQLASSEPPIILTRSHLETPLDTTPTLSTMIQRYAMPKELHRADEPSKRDLDPDSVEISKLLITLIPERKPHKVAAARSLTEMFYHQQTLQLPKLLLRAHKALNSDAFETSLVEGKVSVLFSRIEELKRKNAWSLRQPRKYVDPFLWKGGKSHWDHLLGEAKWASTDMRQERRFHIAQCVMLAQGVLDYFTYGKVCCIKAAAPRILTDEEIAKRLAPPEPEEPEEPEEAVEASKTDDAEEKATEKAETAEEQSIEDTEKKPAGEKAEGTSVDAEDKVEEDSEKPETAPELKPEEKAKVADGAPVSTKMDTSDSNDSDIMVDAQEHILPPPASPGYIQPEAISNFKLHANFKDFSAVEASIMEQLHTYEPFGSKEKDHVIDREFYGHISALLAPPDEAPEFDKLVFREREDYGKQGFSYQKGLFGPYRRYNILRPPRPPPIRNIELRIPTIWLPQDDRHLIKYVTEFSFNWEIISAHLAPRPTRRYFSNIERRTPWQCFERYIQLNDRFQFSDMRGAYASAAKEWLEAAHKVQATTRRRISPLGVGQESIQRGHRRLRWASMLEAIRKLMRKRESVQRPPPLQRKPAAQTSFETPTPEQLVKLKQERDRAVQAAYAHNGKNRAPPEQLQRLAQLHHKLQKRDGGSGDSKSSSGSAPTAEHFLAGEGSHAGSVSSSNSRPGSQSASRAQSPVAAGAATGAKPRISFTTAQVSAVISQIQARNPNLSKEQVTRLAVAYLASYQQKVAQRQAQKRAQQADQFNDQQSLPSQQGKQGHSVSPQVGSSSLSGKTHRPLTPQQLTMLANNPSLTPQQRQQVHMLRQRQQLRQEQQRRSASSQGSSGSGHTPTPEEIQQVMNQRRPSSQQPSPASQHASIAPSPRTEKLNLEAIENDILNTDFSLGETSAQ